MTDVRLILGAFQQEVEAVVGMYHDARTGFRLNAARLLQTQQDIVAAHPGDPELGSIAILDTKRHFYGRGEPWADSSLIQHVSTQREFKTRNAEDGDNHRLVGNTCVVMLFNYWEDHYRQALSEALGLKSKDELKAPIFGDLRLLRNSIVHHRGLALKEVERCELLQWFRERDLIAISEERFDVMIGHVRAYLSSLVAA